MPTPAYSSAAQAIDTTPNRFVLPLAALQALWHDSLLAQRHLLSAHSPRSLVPSQDFVLAHGSIVLQASGVQMLALVGPLRTTPLSDAWTPPDPMQIPREGICLVVITHSNGGNSPPDLSTAEDWLVRHANAWRLASRALRPCLALFWMSANGQGFLGWRNTTGQWSAVPSMELAGSALRHVPMTVRNPAGEEAQYYAAPAINHAPDTAPNLDRYSRQREALGTEVMQKMQQRCTVFIGLGRTGSPLVHSAVRLGMPVLGLDPDVLEPHNLDGDFSPLHEGWTKAAALRKQLTHLARPGAPPDLRALDVASPASGALIAATNGMIVTAVDNSRALLWANAWALALNKVHIVVASGISGSGGLAEAELRILMPGQACVMCAGGLGQPLEQVLADWGQSHAPRSNPFDEERPGSLRSWSVLAGHHALRLLEQVTAGRVRHSLFRRLTELSDGGLRVEDRPILRPAGGRRCVMCHQLAGAGLRAVSAERLMQLLEMERA